MQWQSEGQNSCSGCEAGESSESSRTAREDLLTCSRPPPAPAAGYAIGVEEAAAVRYACSVSGLQPVEHQMLRAFPCVPSIQFAVLLQQPGSRFCEAIFCG
mmetsp:Transcript_45202/g.72806  ORF Transcript_45202/g.72806 Transcript_45202/m.72806 type:complete len:101 (-) Transcript_45202:16-318(-)